MMKAKAHHRDRRGPAREAAPASVIIDAIHHGSSSAQGDPEETFHRPGTRVHVSRANDHDGPFSVLGLGSDLIRSLTELGYNEPTPVQVRAMHDLCAGADVFVSAPRASGKATAAVIATFEILLRLIDAQRDHAKICFMVPDLKAVAQINYALSDLSRSFPQVERDINDRLKSVIADTCEGFERALGRSQAGVISRDVAVLVIYRPEAMRCDILKILAQCEGRPQLVIMSDYRGSPPYPASIEALLKLPDRQFVHITDATLEETPKVSTTKLDTLPTSDNHTPKDERRINQPTAVARSRLVVADTATVDDLHLNFAKMAVSSDQAGLHILSNLDEFQTSFQHLKQQYFDDWEALRMKYYGKLSPLLQHRKEILTSIPKHADIAVKTKSGTPNIPGFWLQAMKYHTLLEDLIEPADEDILHYLIDIDYVWVDNNRGESAVMDDLSQSFKSMKRADTTSWCLLNGQKKSYVIRFHFAENPYFTNSVLTKAFVVQKTYINGNFWTDTGEDVLSEAIGCEIDWKPEKSLVSNMIVRRQRNRKTQQIRQIQEHVPLNSFFNLFHSHCVPDKASLESLSKHEIEDLDVILELEFEVGVVLRDKIIPNAVGWFLGLEQDNDFDDSSDTSEYE